MVNRHQSLETELLGRMGQRFLAQFMGGIQDGDMRPESNTYAMSEYGYFSKERPPGNKTDKMSFDIVYVICEAEKTLSIGVEVKALLFDLLYGEKLHYQIDVADYLFLAVPRALIPAAKYVIEDQRGEDVPRIGLVDLTDGDIVIFPQPGSANSILSLSRSPQLREPFQKLGPSDQSIPAQIFFPMGQLSVNRRYRGLLSKPYKPELPPHGICYKRYQFSDRFQRLARHRKP